MGVPKLFKIILDRFPKSHEEVKGQPMDYLFIDYNSIIYEAYEIVKTEAAVVGPALRWTTNKNAVEDRIIKHMITLTHEMVVNYVKPKKLVYIAFDGPPPRAKMIEQRNRRYKKLYGDMILNSIQDKYGVHVEPIWDRTNITPGTEFMKKASQALNNAIRNGRFPQNLEYVLSDASVPGEGEQKFLKYLDALAKSNVCIYSNDGDLLMLVHRFPQHKTYILTKPKETFNKTLSKYLGAKYFYVVVDGINVGLQDYFKRLKDSGYFDLNRIKKDYIFFSMFGGNDFVHHLYFLKMKEEHTPKVLMGVYQALLPKHGYLVNENLTINQPFLLEYLQLLARQERKWLRALQDRLNNNKPQQKNKNKELSPWEQEWDHFQHTYYYKKDHPQYQDYKDEFSKVDYYLEPNHLWKAQYYKEFFKIDYTDKKMINQICFQYLKSLFFTIKYYLDELPSWGWYYPYDVAPLPSDLVRTLERIKDVNTVFKFDKGRPFKPLEQLMLVLPHQNKLLPPNLIKIQEKHPEFYPHSFELNVLSGLKYIYSDPDLPRLNAKVILNETRKAKLPPKYVELNKLNLKPLFYPIVKKTSK